ncbi:lipopolysaccharide biosynthesis protein [Rhodococcus sp. NPDC060090]|uniref:lipopolysaccharide biosynthesis protein n=1 Tax=Rhodococcus sp. NPDC060090 TaxID=3347056 RepID=UPI00364954DC
MSAVSAWNYSAGAGAAVKRRGSGLNKRNANSGLAKQFSWVLLGRLAGALLQAGSMALLARWSGPSGFGLFASIYGIALIIQTFIDFGLTTYIIRLRAQNAWHGSVGGSLRLIGQINVLVGAILVLVTCGLSVWDGMFLPFVPLAVWVVADRQVETWLGVPLADGNTWQNASSLVLRRSLALVILLGGYYWGVDALLAYATGLALSSLIACAPVMMLNRAVSARNSGTSIELLRAARPYWFNSLATQARNFDAALVAIIASPVSAGYYGAASRLTTPLRMIPTSFAAVLMPAATRAGGENKMALVRSVLILTAFTTVLYASLAVVIPFVVPVVLGEEFDAAVPVIQIVCGGLVFAAIASQLGALMQGWGHARAVAVVSSGTTLVCLLGIMLLTPWVGVLGAGFALAGSYVVQVLVQLVFLWANDRRSIRAIGVPEYRGSAG